MNSTPESLVQKLDWDSEFFGYNLAFVRKRSLTLEEQGRIEEFVREERIVFLQFLCDSRDRSSVIAAEASGYSFVDMRVTVRRLFPPEPPAPDLGSLRFARAPVADIPGLRAIAHESYRDSRYYFDGHFDEGQVAELYSKWVENGVYGALEDYVYALYEGAAPVAFCSIKELSPKEAKVGLVGVDATLRKRGLGKLLLTSVLSQIHRDGFESLITVTQGRNYSAQQLYQRCGFTTEKVELWYHKWYR